MPTITDAQHTTHHFVSLPKRIVSLVPSTTETLYALGLGDSIVGVTRYCVHPTKALQEKVIVGGTKQCNIDRILDLKPDVVFCNQEENTPEIVANLRKHQIPVVVQFPQTPAEAVQDIKDISHLFNKEPTFDQWFVDHTALQKKCNTEPFHYVYCIWRKPWMVIGGNTFIDAQLRQIGGQNVFSDAPERYPAIEPTDLLTSDAHILLSSEPYPFNKQHVDELISLGISAHRIHFINGEYCSWHGIRMSKALQYFEEWKDALSS